ncbi:MAG: sigma-70 family RNA polymerase sigma factor [Muribaculaceae bacterium]|nr:sigma-70 family RNA polymerase sigma factor [Muribaculaceae bacterium]
MENFICQLAQEYFEDLRPAFFNFIRRSFPLCDDEIAGIYSDVWIDAIENVRRGRTERVGNWKAYLFGLGWKRACKIMTRGMRTDSLDIQDSFSPEFQTVCIRESEEDAINISHLEKIEMLMTELEQLPDKHRVVLELYYLKGMSTAEIAETMGYSGARSVITVKRRSVSLLQQRLEAVA